MTRPLLTAFLLGIGLLLASPGCKDEGIGDPCTPEQEYNPSFLGFDEKEVNVESKSFQCRTRICLVNHFRGRTQCPYGQSGDGTPPAGVPDDVGGKNGCTLPGNDQAKVTGLTNPNDPASYADERKKSLVTPQCVDRAAVDTVYCSCRCADINGEKPSNQAFCDCPDAFECRPLVTSIGQGNEGLTGSYCIKKDTEYNKDTACNQGDCAPGDPARKCGE